MNYKEFLYDKDKVLSFYPELAVIFNKYDDMEIERIKREEEEAEEKGIVLEKKEKRPDKNGLGKAIVVNQLNYWLNINEKAHHNFYDGYYWLYFTYEKWVKEDFRFWSSKTLQRILTSLENTGIIVSSTKYNKLKIDNTKWYRIDYDRLQEIIDIVKNKNQDSFVSGQVVSTVWTDCLDHQDNLSRPLPENTNRDYYTKDYCNKKDAFELSNGSMDALKPKGYKEMASKYNNKNDYSEEELTTYISHVIDSIMENEYMIAANEKMCVELKRIIFYFYSEYNRIFQDKHPILSDISYGNIVDRYMNPSGRNMSNDEIKDFETYKKMIDRYFATDFGKYKGTPENFNYRISHFMSDAIRENLYMKVI